MTTGFVYKNDWNIIVQIANGGSKTLTWPTNIEWQNDSAPRLSLNGIDIIYLIPISKNVVRGSVKYTILQKEDLKMCDYKTERYIGENLFTETGVPAVVKALVGEYSSQGGAQIRVVICRDIYQHPESIEYSDLLTPGEFKKQEIQKALAILEKYNYNTDKKSNEA